MDLNVENIVRELIEKTVHMSLATVSNNKPWVCEVHFGYDSNLNLYFVSDPNARHSREIRKYAAVAGNIIRQHSLEEYPAGLYFEGEANEIEMPSEAEIDLYCRRLGRDQEELRETLNALGGKRMYKITVENWAIFGKFDDSGKGKKHELPWNGGEK